MVEDVKILELRLELWITRRELAETSIQLWSYKQNEAREASIKVAEQLKPLKGSGDGTESN